MLEQTHDSNAIALMAQSKMPEHVCIKCDSFATDLYGNGYRAEVAMGNCEEFVESIYRECLEMFVERAK